MSDQEKIAELSKLLREAAHLGLTFSRGSAYISRSYITKQDALLARIKTALNPVEAIQQKGEK